MWQQFRRKVFHEYYILEILAWMLFFSLDTFYLLNVAKDMPVVFVIMLGIYVLTIGYYSYHYCNFTAAMQSILTFGFIVVIFNTLIIVSMSLFILYYDKSDDDPSGIPVYLLYTNYFIALIMPFSIILIESAYKISKFTRFVAPLLLCIISIYNVYYTYFDLWYDIDLITFKTGNSITARNIQAQAWLQIFIFFIRMVFRVFIDPNHTKFSLIGMF